MALKSPIVISLPTLYWNEPEAFRALVEAGAEIIHFRKPFVSVPVLQEVLEQIDSEAVRSALTVHYHPELAVQYGLRGFHYFIGQLPKIDGLRRSASCHNWEEVLGQYGTAEYVFLSPVFDSVSKPGYRRAFDWRDLRQWLAQPQRPLVAALGGITAENIRSVREAGFEAAACLGSVWETCGDRIDIPATVRKFDELQRAWSETK